MTGVGVITCSTHSIACTLLLLLRLESRGAQLHCPGSHHEPCSWKSSSSSGNDQYLQAHGERTLGKRIFPSPPRH